MKEYVISIIVVSIIGSVVSVIAPEGEGGGLSRHVRLAVGVCIILVCFAPTVRAVEWLGEFDIGSVLPDDGENAEQYESIFDRAYSEAEIDNLCEGIKSVVAQKFGLDPLSFKVSVRLNGDEGEKSLSRVTLTLYGSAIWADTGAIEEYLSSLLGCEIITIIG
jgi:hypothetical protein